VTALPAGTLAAPGRDFAGPTGPHPDVECRRSDRW